MTMRTIEVYADVGCPFAHVGLRRFVEHRERLGRDDVVLRVRSWPLELVNGEALDPRFIAEEVDDIRGQVADDLFTGFDVRTFPSSTIAAMTAAELAYEVSDVFGELVSLTLRTALFEHGRAVGTRDELDAIVAECHRSTGADGQGDVQVVQHADVDVDIDGDPQGVVERSWRQGVARGVTGSPHFFIGSDDFFCPALEIERVDGHLRLDTDREAWGRFLDAAFADAR